MIYSQIRQYFYSLLGILLGLGFGTFFFPMLDNKCLELYSRTSISENSDEIIPKINLAAKPIKAQKNPQKVLRPRYYSTELGIKKKLFVAVLTSQSSFNSRVIAINKTASHLVDKLIFFVDAPGTQKLNISHLKLSGIVRFTDTRAVWRPFHVLRYIKDNLIDSYNYFFIIYDSAYIKALKLYEMTRKISVSQHVYASAKIHNSDYCSLSAGILFSNSIVHNMVNNMDWCVKNILSSSDDINIGRCVKHSSNLSCQQLVQGNKFSSYFVENEENLNRSNVKSNEALEAITVYPVKNVQTFYLLHSYFTIVELEKTDIMIASLRKQIVNISYLISENPDLLSWPIGNSPENKPKTRFDVVRWTYFTDTHIYLSSELETVRKLNEAEKFDIDSVIKASIKMIKSKYNGLFKYHSLINGYFRFDPSRGMDYKLDLYFRNKHTYFLELKRVEICKPLGKAEMIPMPYVTENRRINILLPIRVNDKTNANKFLLQYKIVCLQKREKTFLLLIFIYEYNMPGKGTKDDVFKDLKNQAVILTKTFLKDDNRVGWLSIKLPFSEQPAIMEALLNFAIVDLSLKKFTSDSLVVLAKTNMEIKIDYFNRVRMNTILDWQIFSAIPFAEYDPSVHQIDKTFIDINKNFGHFDSNDTFHVSFYVKDYISIRHKIKNLVPIVKSDTDIKLFRTPEKDKEVFISLATNTLYSMFIRFGDLHVLRAVEPALILKFQKTNCTLFQRITDLTVEQLYDRCILERNFNAGSKSQLAKLILDSKMKDV